MLNVLGVSGSLRKESVNTRFLKLLQKLAPDDIKVNIFEQIGNMPFFNPDKEKHPNKAVINFRQAISSSDIIVIASPEYAHGVTGVMKNALDWLVGSGEFTDKMVALPMVTSRSQHSPLILSEVITVMGANVMKELSPVIKIPYDETNLDMLIKDPKLNVKISQFLTSCQNSLSL